MGVENVCLGVLQGVMACGGGVMLLCGGCEPQVEVELATM